MTHRSLTLRRVGLVVAGLLVVAAFAAGGSRTQRGFADDVPAAGAAPTRACHGGTVRAAQFRTVVTSTGLSRSALVHVPRQGGPTPAPLVLAFHGSGGTGTFMQRYSGLSKVADAAGFVAVYPESIGPRWALEPAESGHPDDARFIRRLIDVLGGLVCFDKNRIYATGVSNGGGFTARLACEVSDRIAAIAPVAGGYADLPECTPERPVSVLEIHGTADEVVPYAGRDGRGAAKGFAADWAGRDGCHPQPVRSRVAARTVRFDWGPCAAGADVAHIAIVHGAHAWPGAVPPDPGPPAAIVAAPVIWEFLSAHRLAVSAVANSVSR
jgi:polyhydroxybutyrate depolymerase